MRAIGILLALMALTVICPMSGVARASSPNADVATTMQCKALSESDLSGIQDAPTQITNAEIVEASNDQPAYCKVSGYISPQIGIELRLPLINWNGKFFEVGCGGTCGHLGFTFWCPLDRGYACIVSDMGHTGGGTLWAYNNLQAQIDYAYRSAHVAALAGKTITERFYSRPPAKSYFMGCSTGGRQAMEEAQNFPWDFDGIIAASPSVDHADILMNDLWDNRAMTDRAGQPILSSADLELLHRSVVDKCDMNDGVKDGLIGDPRSCTPPLTALTCKSEKKADCLTATQVEAARKIYSGPVTSKGEQIYIPAAMPGSELVWLDWFVGRKDAPHWVYNRIRDDFRYLLFQPAPGPTWKPEDFDFDRDYKRIALPGNLSAGTNPDLRKFKASGGKLIAYAGWNDATGPLGSVDYYETTEKTLGGRVATQSSFRLFMVPGMEHCTGGEGAFAIDFLTALENWVEHARPPDKLIGAHVDSHYLQQHGDAFQLKFPLSPTVPVTFTRPIYPYPFWAKYKGSGDPNKAESFKAAER